MNINKLSLSFSEKTVFLLRSIYEKYGYSQYKMSKFEEYDLYAKNKDFLISDGVITFTDTNGKLMALKPDVTLSIIKNTKDESRSVQKLYYNENVYRTSKGTGTFKEIMQVGLECIGDIDDYSISEVILLACKSLKEISNDSVLDISHSGFVSYAIDTFGISDTDKVEIMRCISDKNVHELKSICDKAQLTDKKTNALVSLITTYGSPATALATIKECFVGLCDTTALYQLSDVISALNKSGIDDMLRIDFSCQTDVNYYNGIAFKGFVPGIPTVVLSGGQYDKLMEKMHRKSGAIGFAVYLDTLERFEEAVEEYDVDKLVIYNENTDMNKLNEYVSMLIKENESVMVQREIPEALRYKELVNFGEVK